MSERVIDIIPPSKKRDEEVVVQKKKKSKKWVLVLFMIVLLSFSFLYVRSYRVEVKIYPHTEQFTDSKTIFVHVDGEYEEVTVDVFEEIIEGQREFIVKGRALIEEKARGLINVCQEYSDTSQSLVAGTRFVSGDGKLFISPDRILIPGRSYQDDRIVPGCVSVEVVAAEAGEEYNISSSSRFSLPALQGTAAYSRFFGESFTITQDGLLKEVSSITSEEIMNAEDILLEELFEKSKIKLKDRLNDNYLLENREQYRITIIERSNPREGEQADSFIMDMKIRVEVIAVDVESIDNFAKNMLPENYTWQESSKKIDYEFSRINFEDKNGEVDITLTSQIHEKIDIPEIKRNIASTDFTSATRYIKSISGVKETEIDFYPFGPSKIPNNTARIRTELMFDKN